MSDPDPLVSLVVQFAAALEAEGFAYALIGALGRNAWARPRATTDADFALAVPPSRVDRLRALIEDHGLRVRRERAGEPGDPVPELLLLSAKDDPSLRLDLLLARTPFEDAVLDRRVRVSVLGSDFWVATAEDLLVYKLIAGRPRDLADVEEIARTRVLLGQPVDWAYVESWAEEFGVIGRLDILRRTLRGS